MSKTKKAIIFNCAILLIIAILLLISFYQLSLVNNVKIFEKNLFIVASIFLTIITIAISNIIFFSKNVTTEKVFLLTVPIICIIFMICMPMFRSHDELRHWTKAYEISTGKFVASVIDEKVQSELPTSVANGVNKYWRNIKYGDVIKSLNNDLNENDTKLQSMKEVALYSPVQYMPQVLGILIAKIFTNKVIILAYMARLFNLIISVAIMYLTIKTIPYGKKVLLLLSLLPLSIEAFSSMSPDAITISVIFLFIAYVLKLKENKEELINKKDILILSILSIIIALCKIVYIPIVFLLLLLPKEKFKTHKQKYLIIIPIITFSIIINLIWLRIANSFLSVSSQGSSATKVVDIIKNPIKYVQILLYTMNYYGNSYFNTLFGSVLAWGEYVKLYFIVPFTFGTLFMFESTTDKELKEKFRKYDIIIMLLISIAVIGLIFTSLYIQWTDTEKSVLIQGIQGRYFIPIMPLVALLLSKIKIHSDYKPDNILKIIGISSILLQIYIMLSIIIVHV